MTAHVLTVVGYILATLLVQGTSHFAINAAHYAAVDFNRAEPIFALGVGAMIVQGAVLSAVYIRSRFADGRLISALQLSWLFGAFLASYMALALAGEYEVPSIASWIVTEMWVAAIQFTLIGLALWFAHSRFGAATVRA